METKNEQEESSPELLVEFLITRWSRREFRDAMFMSQMLSSADQRITLGLSELIGKPAVFIWNEKSKQCVLLIHSSLEILLFKLLHDGPGSLSSEEGDSKLRMLFGMDAQSWPQFIQRMFSGTLDSTVFSLKTSAASLVQSKASFEPFEFAQKESTLLRVLGESAEPSMLELSVPMTSSARSLRGMMTGIWSALVSPLMGKKYSSSRSTTPSHPSESDGETSSDTSSPPSSDPPSSS